MAFNVGYDGIDASFYTAKSALTTSDIGKLVKHTTNDTVAVCSADDKFDGIAEQVAQFDSAVTVQHKGFVVNYDHDGTVVSNGRQELAAKTASSVQKVAAGSGVPVVVVNFTTTKVTFRFV